MKTVELDQTTDDLAALIDQLQMTGEVIFIDHDMPVAKLVPYPTATTAILKAGCLKGFGMAADFDAPLEDFKDYLE